MTLVMAVTNCLWVLVMIVKDGISRVVCIVLKSNVRLKSDVIKRRWEAKHDRFLLILNVTYI